MIGAFLKFISKANKISFYKFAHWPLLQYSLWLLQSGFPLADKVWIVGHFFIRMSAMQLMAETIIQDD